MGVAFSQTQEKGTKDKQNMNLKGESYCFHHGKKYN